MVKRRFFFFFFFQHQQGLLLLLCVVFAIINGVESFSPRGPLAASCRRRSTLPPGCRRASSSSSSSSTEPPPFLSTPSSTTPTTSQQAANNSIAQDWQQFYLPLIQFMVHSFLLALLLVSWEDVACTYALPSRQQQQQQQQQQRLQTVVATNKNKNINPTINLNHLAVVVEASNSRRSDDTHHWGQSTVRGLGFGRNERLALEKEEEKDKEDDDDDDDDATTFATVRIPSYNEVLKTHREQRVPSWQATASRTDQARAVHTLLECYRSIQQMRQHALQYQWNAVRESLHAPPWTQLETAATALRGVDPAVGFDWASCAWRHCGALADVQEALDELDALTGVLEPFEALFCLDIVERAVRDMLTEAPWPALQSVQSAADVQAWQTLPPYQAHRIFLPPNDSGNPIELQEADEASRLDEEYLKALQELRIEDE